MGYTAQQRDTIHDRQRKSTKFSRIGVMTDAMQGLGVAMNNLATTLREKVTRAAPAHGSNGRIIGFAPHGAATKQQASASGIE